MPASWAARITRCSGGRKRVGCSRACWARSAGRRFRSRALRGKQRDVVSRCGSLLQKIPQQPLPLFGEEALGVVLHALKRPGFVADAHDLVLGGPAADLELAREGAVADDEAV